MKKSTKLIALLCAIAMLLCFSACGNSAAEPSDSAVGEPENNTPAEPENGAADAPENDAPAGDFTTIQSGKLIMSTEAFFPPYEFIDDDGSLAGIDIELAAAVAEKLGLELQIDDMDFDAALLAVQQGKSDIVMAGVTITDERKLVMEFSDSYATGIQVVIVPEGSDIKTIDDLEGKQIGTQRGTTGNIYCIDDFGDEHVIGYDNGITAVQALNNGQVDCVVIDSAPAESFVASNPGLVILDTEYAVEDYAIGITKDNLALKAAIDDALAQLTADGTVQRIIDKYISAD